MAWVDEKGTTLRIQATYAQLRDRKRSDEEVPIFTILSVRPSGTLSSRFSVNELSDVSETLIAVSFHNYFSDRHIVRYGQFVFLFRPEGKELVCDKVPTFFFETF